MLMDFLQLIKELLIDAWFAWIPAVGFAMLFNVPKSLKNIWSHVLFLRLRQLFP